MMASSPHIGHWLRFAAGLGVTFGLSWLCMRCVAPLGWMDHPRGRRQHVHPTPRTGGMALLGALGFGAALGWLNLPLSGWEWAIVCAMGCMGILDDRFDLPARWKALFSLGVAAALAGLTWSVLRNAGTHLPLFNGYLATRTGLALALLCAWYWATPQACNLIDGMNGLALGFFLLLGLSLGLPLGEAGFGAYLLGALAALVILNWPFGLQFLGDSGALLLGTLFAVLALRLLGPHNLNWLLWAFAYPIVDVLMVMAIRVSTGHSLGEGDRSHFHHQWLALVGGNRQLALVLTLLPAFATMQMLKAYPGHEIVAEAGAVWLALVATWFYLRGTHGRRGEVEVGNVEPLQIHGPRAAVSGEFEALRAKASLPPTGE